jgi:signal recognition particle subunit SEC65
MNPVIQKYGESLDIYPIKPISREKYDMASVYNLAPPENVREMPTFKLKGTEANDLYKDFKANPNLNNAHQLQQKIGEQIGTLKKGPQDSATRKQLRNLNSAYEELNSKIDSRLQEVDPEAAKQWKEGRQYHKENVIPYRSNKKIKSIVEGKTTNPKDIHKPFEYPGEKLDKQAKQYIKDDANKIISDLPEESKNKILFSKIGGSSSNKEPNQLLSNLEKAKDKGGDTYFNKDLDNKMNTLRKQIRNESVVNPLNWVSHMIKRAIGK